MRSFSFIRWWAVVRKEFVQLMRDRVTFAMIVGVPIMQLILFGYAINNDPKHLPTAVIATDQSEFTRSFLAAMKTTEYFAFKSDFMTETEARDALVRGDVQFVVQIPADFSQKLVRGERPAMLLQVDATDPVAAGTAVSTIGQLANSVAQKDLRGPLAKLAATPPPFEVRVQKLYNPEGLTQLNIVPGLMGIILSMTMVMMTGLAITRERERGTMENLLATPTRPVEVMTGKIIPYIFIGLIQVTIIVVAAIVMFDVPFVGSPIVLYSVAGIFIAASLTVGITISSVARNQLQAMQLTMFYFLPSLLLSGFMFPFRGMPQWAQAIGEVVPTTYFMRAVRGILLKGSGWGDLWPDIWPMLAFTVVSMIVALTGYRKTLD